MTAEVRRKLTTVLAADAEGYSRLMERDEVRALGALRAARAVFAKFIEAHHGRIANTAGDGLIAEFPSVVEAVQCAIDVQRELADRGAARDDGLRFRIGLHLGDVLVEGEDLLGEGVNLAARLQTMAEPGGVLISQQVYDQVHAKLAVGFEYLGERRPRNLSEEVAVYRVALGKTAGRTAWWPGRADSTPRPERRAQASGDAKEDLRARLLRHAKLLGALFALLLATDLFSGEGFWAHWPGLVLATLLALEAAPLFVEGGLAVYYARFAVVVGALAAINLFTWSGYPWAIWPAGALLAVELLRRLGIGRR